MKKLLLPLLAAALALLPTCQCRVLLFCAECRHSAAGEKVFITWDPVKQLESFTVDPSSRATPWTSAWSFPRRRNPSCMRCRAISSNISRSTPL